MTDRHSHFIDKNMEVLRGSGIRSRPLNLKSSGSRMWAQLVWQNMCDSACMFCEWHPTLPPFGWLDCVCVCMCACPVAQLCLTLLDPMDCSPPGSSVYGISQARILEWSAISHSRRSSQHRDWTHISCVPCIGRQTLYHCATWETRVIRVYWPIKSPHRSEKKKKGIHWRHLQKHGWTSRLAF